MTDLRHPVYGKDAADLGARLAATPKPIAALDVPLAVVEADVRAIAEQRHQLDIGADLAFARLASAHPEACATAADYPNWTPGRTK